MRSPPQHFGGSVLAAAFVSWFAVTPLAHAAGAPLSLAETLRLAVAQSPEIAAQRAMAEGATAGIVPAGQLPDPKLKTVIENVPTNTEEAWTAKQPVTMLRVGLSQEFPGGNKLELRTRRAELDAQKESVMSEVQKAMVQRDAATAWVALRFALESEAKVNEQIAEAELGVETARVQYRTGKTMQSDLLMMQGAVVDLKNKRTDIGVQVKRARIALSRLIGTDADRPIGDAPDLSRLPPDIIDFADTNEFPEVRAARAQETIAAAEANLAEADYWPDWKVELTYSWRGRSPIVALPFQPIQGGTPYAQLISLEVTVDLPFWTSKRQGPRYEAKLKELDAARASLEDAKRKQAAEVKGMIAEWEGARIQARRMKDEMIPLTVQRKEAAMAAYRGGMGSLTAVLEARRMELDAYLSLVQMEQMAGKAWAWLAFVYPIAEHP